MNKNGKSNILITGGAGFIGSNLVEAFLRDERVGQVRVLDNFSTGFRANLTEFEGNPRFEIIEGDIRNYETCLVACQNMDLVSHQAALGSVPRSINDPLTTNEVNITGTLNMMTAVKNSAVRRIIFAASSSTYGDSAGLPKVENVIGRPLSPYAVTKFVNELYAQVFASAYGMEFVGLRYFNVFGPKQSPNGAYAAVIPLFVKNILDEKSPIINGDGSFSRDFTFVENAVQANMLALFTENEAALNQIFNVACGERTTLLQLFNHLKSVAGSDLEPVFGPNRAGDIPHSLASIEKAEQLLGYAPQVSVKKGLEKAFAWYSENLQVF